MKYAPVRNFIGGEWMDASDAKTLEVISPVDGMLLSVVPMSTSIDLDKLRELIGLVTQGRTVFFQIGIDANKILLRLF